MEPLGALLRGSPSRARGLPLVGSGRGGPEAAARSPRTPADSCLPAHGQPAGRHGVRRRADAIVELALPLVARRRPRRWCCVGALGSSGPGRHHRMRQGNLCRASRQPQVPTVRGLNTGRARVIGACLPPRWRAGSQIHGDVGRFGHDPRTQGGTARGDVPKVPRRSQRTRSADGPVARDHRPCKRVRPWQTALPSERCRPCSRLRCCVA